MKIPLDDTNYIEVRAINGKVKLSIKARKDKKTTVLVTTEMDEETLSTLVSSLVAAKADL
jgi:hypothetical protein